MAHFADLRDSSRRLWVRDADSKPDEQVIEFAVIVGAAVRAHSDDEDAVFDRLGCDLCSRLQLDERQMPSAFNEPNGQVDVIRSCGPHVSHLPPWSRLNPAPSTR